MASERSKKLVFDALHAVENIEHFLEKETKEAFLQSELLQSAVERQFEIIGEALNRLSRTDETSFYAISSSQQIVGMRNFIAHGYDAVDPRILWQTYLEQLPLLKSDLTKLL